jgi:6,7-dimethyl-8-ribityllumazine synthase
MLQIKPTITKMQSKKIVIIVSQFNDIIVDRLLEGALNSLERSGVNKDNITVIWVPGAYEIPAMALKVGEMGLYDGIITLGAVIKGETDHYDLVINAVNSGISKAAIHVKIPLVFGVVTTDTLEQAQQRSGGKAGNKGAEVANALLDVISVYEQLDNNRRQN